MSEDKKESDDSTRKLGMGMVIAMWVVLLVLLTAYFSNWQEQQFNPNQTLHNISRADGVNEVVLKRNRYGHYVASGAINDVPVVFMLDTGATDISIPQAIADRIGLERGAPVYYQTANGTVRAYITQIDSVSLGDIRLSGLRAHINPQFESEEILLGMTFLKRLDFTQRGNTLTLSQIP